MINDLAKRLKDMRNKFGLSQNQVAQRLGVTPSMVSAYECAAREPSLVNLINLANLYHCSTDYLLGLTVSPGRKAMEPFSDEQAAALINFINANRAK